MNPGPAGPISSAFSLNVSPLHPPSVMHNARILSSLATLTACFSGAIAGILGLTNLSGFLLYLNISALSALIIGLIKCKGDIGRYVPDAHAGNPGAGGLGSGGGSVQVWKGWWALTGLGQENLLGFLLFWIGGYALIHVYD